ncbi:MAG: hypothetical protein HFF09_02140 [Oscillospiraceae bacterium]|nr:hypothetical protein [Oscillospiraceae bacterium]
MQHISKVFRPLPAFGHSVPFILAERKSKLCVSVCNRPAVFAFQFRNAYTPAQPKHPLLWHQGAHQHASLPAMQVNLIKTPAIVPPLGTQMAPLTIIAAKKFTLQFL